MTTPIPDDYSGSISNEALREAMESLPRGFQAARAGIDLYLDCSGSILQHQLQPAFDAACELAAERGLRLRATCFAHWVGPTLVVDAHAHPKETLTTVLQRSAVQGGTDFVEVWHRIAVDHQHSLLDHEVPAAAIIVTDFQWFMVHDSSPAVVEAARMPMGYVPVEGTRPVDVERFAERMKDVLDVDVVHDEELTRAYQQVTGPRRLEPLR